MLKFKDFILEEHGAGDWGTKQLVDKYKKDTPGQTPNNLQQNKKEDKNKNDIV